VLNDAAASAAFNRIQQAVRHQALIGERQMGIKNRSAANSAAFPSSYGASASVTSAMSSAMTYAAQAAQATYFVNSQPSAEPLAAASDDALPLNTFLKELRREERRCERSGRALSMVIYRFDDSTKQGQATAERLLKAIYSTKRETDVVGLISGGSDARAVASTVALLCPDTAEAGLTCLKAKISKLAGPLACSATSATYPDDLFLSLSAGLPMPPAFVSLHAVEPSVFVEAASGAVGEARGGEYRFKRALDIAGASVLLLVLALPMLLVAAAVALTSSGSPIFKQTRVGKGGLPFTFYKFRSMVVDSDDRIHREFVASLIKGSSAPSGEQDASCEEGKTAFYKLKADPRVTPLGRFIRKTSIDELPQLFNVLKGDMSLVGPRPPIPYESTQYQPWHLRRILAIKPGITGLWQVEGRSNVGFSDMVRLDLRYLRDCSFRLDMKILWKTVGAVIRCDGAA
jgi:lipopolysaccharide/colanic/teichoic acid biosynthesis glycosyltransferase